jgi:hypothetical protein
MAELAQERRDRYPNISALKRLPDVRTYDTLVFWGNYSYSIPRDKARLMQDNAIVDIGNGWQTQTEVARDYLKAVYGDCRLRATGRQANYFRLRNPMPLYSKPGVIHDAAYVDLRAAFWSLMQLFGWNVDYNPSRWLTPGRIPYDFPLPDNKVARNSLVTAGLPTPTFIWDGKRFTRRNGGKKPINLGLWACISDYLHLCASYARDCGARWIHTDGYILPRKNAELLQYKIEGLGLSATIKAEGLSVILGQGRYIVGNRVTDRMGGYIGNKVNNLREVDTIFLEKTASWLIKRKQNL